MNTPERFRLVVVSAGTGDPSSTRMLADRTAERATALAAGRGHPVSPGLVIAIEPWFMAGGSDGCRIDKDGWTVRSADGSRAAHIEHTVAVTADGPRILTAP